MLQFLRDFEEDYYRMMSRFELQPRDYAEALVAATILLEFFKTVIEIIFEKLA